MVQLPSTNSVRESRHVAIYGLPHKIADGTLHNFFSKFGAIQDLSRQEGNQDIVYISFMDVRSAARACTTERFDRDTPCRITYCNPDDRPKAPVSLTDHPPCEPSTSNSLDLSKASRSIHVSNADQYSENHLLKKFRKCGKVISVDRMKSETGDVFAEIEFADVQSAIRALADEEFTMSMKRESRRSHMLIVFCLPRKDKDVIVKELHTLSNKIVTVKVDWEKQQAILYCKNVKDARETFREFKNKKNCSLNGVPVTIDYCSEKLDSYLVGKDFAQRPEPHKTPSSSKPTKDGEMQNKKLLRRADVGSSESQSSRNGDDGNHVNCSPASSEDESEDDATYELRNGGHNSQLNHLNSPNDRNSDNRTPPSPYSPLPARSCTYDPPESTEEIYVDYTMSPEDFATKHNISSSPLYRGPIDPTSSLSSVFLRNQERSEKQRAPIKKKEKKRKKNGKREDSVAERSATVSPRPVPTELPDNELTRMMKKINWKGFDISPYPKRIEDVMARCLKTRDLYEKMTGRPFPKFTRENDLKMPNHLLYEHTEHSTDIPLSESEIRWREWNRLAEIEEFEEFRSTDTRDLLRNVDVAVQPSTSRGSGRPSLDEPRSTRLSLDLAHHPHELAQRSQSLCIGPMTPITPYHPATPLLVNTSHTPGPSQPGPSGVVTPRSCQLPPQASPVSRHGSISSTGKPASIQGLRHHSVMFPPDLSIPPPPVPPTHDEMMSAPPSRRSSETITPMPLRSPPFAKQIQSLLSMPISAPPPNAPTGTATGAHSVSSSTTSTPRHSVSGGPVHYEMSTPKSQQPQTPKTIRPEKVQVRHDSISKPGPSITAGALQARSQSVSVADPKKSAPPTPVVRDAGSDLIDQIMSNQPSMGFKKLPKIEKKSSALLQNQQNLSSATSTPSTSNASGPTTQAAFLKDKEKDKRRKERELEREREARKEMKKKETKEERHKRKELERAKREEDERRERKREKQKLKEKEGRKKEKEKEKERRRAEKEKLKRKKHKNDSEETESTSGEEIDLDSRKSNKEMTQEEKDHQLALILSRGGIIENLKSRRRTDKRENESFEKLRQKNQNNSVPRRVLIESSDDDDGADDEDDEKGKSTGSNEEGSDTEPRFLPPPPMPPTIPAQLDKPVKQKVQKEREKGELSSSSEEEEEVEVEEQQPREKEHQRSREKEERENRKRQKSMSAYSSDDHNEKSKKSAKRKKRDDSEERKRKMTWEIQEQQKQRKRKLEHRRSSEDDAKRKAKRDFRDVLLEDVSDEEEDVEEASRARRPSTSSVASTTTEKKSAKTPLRVTTPSITPLQSPKILSPKILSPKIISPKTSSNSTKRPSISDQESLSSLTSPKPRNRTTSSTSTATTISRHESSAPEKALSPTVTAKSSISSVDDFAIREDLSATSAAASPMSVTGRPMVLTKAAMKAFHSSPPKKLRKSSRQHETSSPSSSTSDDSSSSSVTSSDSSDEATDSPAGPEKPSGAVVAPHHRNEIVNPVPLLFPPPPIPPLIPPPPPPPVLEVPVHIGDDEKSQPSAPPTHDLSTLPISEAPEKPSISSDDVQNVAQQKEIEEHEVAEKKKSVSEILESEKTEELTREDAAPLINHTFTHQRLLEAERIESASMKPQQHSLISDQETDQAVQSIFNEEDEEDFPQYPDFVIPKEQKDGAEKEPRHAIDENTDRRNVEPMELDNAIASIVEDNELENHKEYNSDLLRQTSSFDEEKQKELLLSMKGPENCIPNEDSEVVETDREVPMEEMDIQEVLENIEVDKKEIVDVEQEQKTSPAHLPSPEQTPTPELIPNEAAEPKVEEVNEQVPPAAQTTQKQQANNVESLNSSQQNSDVPQPSPRVVSGQPVVQQPLPNNNSTATDDVIVLEQPEPSSNQPNGPRPAKNNKLANQQRAQRIQAACLNALIDETKMSETELMAAFRRQADELADDQRDHAGDVTVLRNDQVHDVEHRQGEEPQENDNAADQQQRKSNEENARKKVNVMQFMSRDAQRYFHLLNINKFGQSAPAPTVPLRQSSSRDNKEVAVTFQKWFYRKWLRARRQLIMLETDCGQQRQRRRVSPPRTNRSAILLFVYAEEEPSPTE